MLKAAFGAFTAERARLNRDTMAVYWYPFDHGFDRVLLALYRRRALTEQDFCRWRDALEAFRRPALVAWGGLDRAFVPRRAAEIAHILPNARLEIFEHANHFLPEDRPEALGRLIDAFVRATTPDTRG
jgi:pimeloyl-ACP methyl ester carboxylesterase